MQTSGSGPGSLARQGLEPAFSGAPQGDPRERKPDEGPEGQLPPLETI